MAKFIAMRPFANVSRLAFQVTREVEENGKKVKKLITPPGIETGEEFVVGGDTTDLAALGEADKVRCQHLLSHNMAIFMDDPANKGRLETLNKHVATEKAKREKDALAAKPVSVQDLIAQVAQLTSLVAALTGKKIEAAS